MSFRGRRTKESIKLVVIIGADRFVPRDDSKNEMTCKHETWIRLHTNQ